MAKRTTHRSRSGKKLYAVRDASGRFEDIQTYERAHGQDLKRGSAAEKKAKVKVKAAVKKKKAAPRRKKAAAKKK
jgi:uncharacterized protein YjhX (UPF0386 family)